ncbi:PorP/SprF family type IX secretion system membrane protein [Paradesertivirga mongoliensis]|uniref:PorP/SprF family type IX secretion system membrane protein n=1 Tax=Paradesertivirga mongoliensis TaxID=2100740 RepID=A0ABW4ZPL1_9SPHI|nr:PorP/SprF family type IX secretion system membrane protein [Pedobacter mongoliensis]
MLKMIFKPYSFLLLVLLCQTAKAQDHIYSQFFNAPIYLNPALAGQFDGSFRVNMIYRNQWSAMSGDLRYISASMDYQLPNNAGGLGLMFNNSAEGVAYLKKNNISGIYSYIIGGDNFSASFGLQAGITNRKMDFSSLIFSDQLDSRLGLTGASTSAESPLNDNKYYFDAGTGANFVIGNAMIGASVLHLNKPDESFTGSVVPTPIRTAVHASYRVPLSTDDEGSYLIPSVVYYKQSQATSISGGMQFKYRAVNAGVWYRTAGSGSSDALVVSFIFDLFSKNAKNQKYRFGVSHDATTSKLNYGNTSGTSEVSFGFETGESQNKGYSTVKCYDFY